MFSLFIVSCFPLTVIRAETVTSHEDYSGDTVITDKAYEGISVLLDMKGSAFDMKNGAINVTSCQFSGCSGVYGTCYFKSVTSAILKNCIWKNNNAGDGGALYFETTQNASIESCTFDGCYCSGYMRAQYGGAIYADVDNMKIANSSVTNSYSKSGGAIYFHEVPNAVLENVNMTDCKAESGGAVYYLNGCTDAAFSNCFFVRCSATSQYGGSLYFAKEHNFKKTSITNCTFDACVTVDNGAAVYLAAGEWCVFQENTIVNTPSSTKGHAVILKSDSIEVISVLIKNNYGQVLEVGLTIAGFVNLRNISMIDNIQSGIDCTKGSIGFIGLKMYGNADTVIKSDQFVIFQDSEIVGNTNSGITLTTSTCSFQNIIVENNNRFTMTITKSSSFEKCTFQNNADLLIDASVVPTFVGVSFNNCTGGTILHVVGNGQPYVIDGLSVTNCENGCGFLIEGVSQLTVKNSNFQNCRSTGNGAALMLTGANCTSVLIHKTTFTACESTGLGSAIYSTVPTTKLTSCTFQKNIGNKGALYVSDLDHLAIHDTHFMFNECNELESTASLCIASCKVSEIYGCLFVLDKAKIPGMTSITLSGGTEDSVVRFMTCCFNTTVPNTANAPVAHILSTFAGQIKFDLPMCFDLSKEESVSFTGIDPTIGMNIFNCYDCQPIEPTEEPTSEPTYAPTSAPTHAPTSAPTHAPTSAPTEAPASESAHISVTEASTDEADSDRVMTGVAVGCGIVVFLVVGFVVITLFIRKRNTLLEEEKQISFYTDGILQSVPDTGKY